MKNSNGEELKEDVFLLVWLKNEDIPYVGIKNSIFGWDLIGHTHSVYDENIDDFIYIRRKKLEEVEIKVYSWYDSDDYIRQALYIDGKEQKTVRSLCFEPEDAIIGRNLLDCEDLVGYIKLGYKLAKEGKTLNIQIQEGCPDD